MDRSALETVEHMARNIGGARRQLGGQHKVGGVGKVATLPGAIALLRLSRIPDLRTVRSKVSQGTTSHARMLARGGVRNTSGVTLSTAGTTAVHKLQLWNLSSREGGGPALAFATQWESRTSGARCSMRATGRAGGTIVEKNLRPGT